MKGIHLLAAITLFSAAYPASKGDPEKQKQHVFNKLKAFFHKLESEAKADSPSAYKGQLAGHLTGGSGTLRNRVVDSKLAHVTLPSVRAGCGGIDLHMGGFSFISERELINALKSIGTNAASYSFLLALETLSPQVANNMKQLQTWANDINNLNINSCETGASLASAVWPRTQRSKELICTNMGTSTGLFRDAAMARHKCGSEPQKQTSKQEQREQMSAQKTSILPECYNIAWEVLKRQQSLAKDPEMRELFMTLTGTVVTRLKDRTQGPQRNPFQSEGEEKGLIKKISQDSNDPAAQEVITFQSKVREPGFLDRLLMGGRVKGYRCRDMKGDKCLEVQIEEVTIDDSIAWGKRMKERLHGIQEKIFSNTELDDDEKNLIETCRFSLFNVINVMSSYEKDRCPIFLHQFSEIVATDMICQFINQVVDVARESALNLRQAQFNSEPIDDFLTHLREIEDEVRHRELKVLRLIDEELKVIQKIELIEERLRSEFRL